MKSMSQLTVPHEPGPQPGQPLRLAVEPAHLLERVFDEIDYSVLLMTADRQLVYANEIARQALAEARVIRLADSKVTACEASRWAAAVRDACCGIRRLVLLLDGDASYAWSLCPLRTGSSPGETPMVLAISGKPSQRESLSIAAYGREMRLTPAEIHVLTRLAAECAPADIAREDGRAESTVRTQIRSVLGKTEAGSLRSLLIRISRLPPVRPLTLRNLALSGVRPAR